MAKDSKKDDDLDYEVVDDEMPRRSRRANDDDEQPRSQRRADEDDRSRNRQRDEDDDDARPASKKRSDDDDEEEDRPRKKKKKKTKHDSLDSFEDPDGRRTDQFDIGDWIIAGLFFSTGIILCMLSAAFRPGEGSVLAALFAMFLSLLIMIPLIVGILMGVGIVLSIDYGEYKAAIIKLAAIITFNNGMMWLLNHWIGLPWFISIGICGLICFGLFMTLFELDVWETNVSLGAINILQFLAFLLIVSLAFAKVRHDVRKERNGGDPPIKKDLGKQLEDDDDGDGPPFNPNGPGRPNGKGLQPPIDDGDEP